jgi:glycerol-3-phosphate dehydrogenase
MDEQGLGQWVQDQALGAGVKIHELVSVERVSPTGWLAHATGSPRYTWLVNAAGPWAVELLQRSGLTTDVRLDLVRGSHLLVPPPAGATLATTGLFVEVPGSARIAFLLPYQGELLVGTTEEVQSLDEPIAASASERELLQGLVARHLPTWAESAGQQGRFFAGIRPIVRGHADVSRANRDAVFRRHGQLISVFGGKWTTARALAERLAHSPPFNGQP